MSIHPQIIEKDGEKEFVVLPYAEFVAMQEALEDYEDLKALRDAKADSVAEANIPYASVRDELLEE
jgi:PHD/YefM family antitoxin component YafN of YafNO toxin-antitoxin module